MGEVGEGTEQISKHSDENIVKKDKKKSRGSNGSFSEFCQETLSWLEEDVFKAPRATIDSFEDDEIVSSFSNFNRLMENLSKENKMSDLSDFDEKPEDGGEVVTKEEVVSEESSSKSSSEEQVKRVHKACFEVLVLIDCVFLQVNCQYTKICSSEEGEDGCSSPLLASSPPGNSESSSDSDTGHAPHVC